VRRLYAVALSLALGACSPGAAQHEDAAAPAQPADAALASTATTGGGPPSGPQGLLHLDEEGVRRLMGDPEFVWSEPDAAMWRYRGQACFVDVFLYPGKGVTYVDVRGDGFGSPNRDACFRSLVEAHAAS
jgi:hypothetical protein